MDNGRHLGVELQRQGFLGDNVDIGLVKLAEASFLRAFAAPDLLNLIAFKGKMQAAVVLPHVTGERYGQIEMQSHFPFRLGLSLQAAYGIDLFVDFAFGFEYADSFNRRCLQAGVAVQFVHAADSVYIMLFNQSLRGQPFGEAAYRCRFYHNLTISPTILWLPAIRA